MTAEEMAQRIENLLTEFYGVTDVYTEVDGNEVVFAKPAVGLFVIAVKPAKVLVADAVPEDVDARRERAATL